MLDPHRRPALEDCPRRRAPRRSAGWRRAVGARPVAASSSASSAATAGRNSSAPTSATGPLIARSLATIVRKRAPVSARGGGSACLATDAVADCADDRPPALDDGRGRPRLVDRVPRRHDRQRGPARRSARSCRPTSLGVLEGQTYINSGYLAVLAALLILGGAISDRYGRKRVFAIGLIGFGATSVLCGLAPTLEALVVFRLLQGAAAALLVPGSLALITSTFEGPALAGAFGVWAAATSAATVLGPVVGGLLVQYISWRVAFLINVPLALVALVGLRRGVAETVREGASGRFDWLGSLDVVLASAGCRSGSSAASRRRGGPGRLGGDRRRAVALVLFPLLMSRRPDPLVPLGLFRNRRFAVINLATFLIYGALYVYPRLLRRSSSRGRSATASSLRR